MVAGTRPEAIKLGPVVELLEADPDLETFLVLTGQHREILEEVLVVFGLEAARNLEVGQPGQGLGSLTARCLKALDRTLEELRPELVLVQGDTTTAFAGALAAFYRRIPVAHVEAGLRSYDLASPFPEEANRKLIAAIASLHFPPTRWARDNLVREGVPQKEMVVTGNTVVDALRRYLSRPFGGLRPEVGRALEAARSSPLVLVTTHRRENWGEPQRRVARALARAASLFPQVHFILPLHPNPVVREVLVPALEGVANFTLTEPLRYPEFIRILGSAWVVVTDSGGVQEEATSLGVPCLVLREVTERPEAVAVGAARLVGTEEERVLSELVLLLGDAEARWEMARASSVFGDGLASSRVHAALRRFFGLTAEGPGEFFPGDDLGLELQFRRLVASGERR